MSKFDETQRNFHHNADIKRFFSRLENPFIKEKEIKLFSLLGLADKKINQILEIGCGEGSNRYFTHITNSSIAYNGLDYSYEKVAFAKRNFPNSTFIQGNATRLPFRPGSFDRVLIRDVLHHVDDKRVVLIQEALKVVKPGGKLIVIEGNVCKLINRIFSLLIPAERGMKNSTPEKFRQLCESMGCNKIEDTEAIFLIRSINYFIGWSNNKVLRFFLDKIYMTAHFLECFIAKYTKKGNQSYMIAYFQR